MTDFGTFRGAAKRIEDIDIPRVAHRIGVGEDELHAVIDVETGNGKGFDGYGRPKMLFEPHIFHREVASAKRAEAAARKLAYPRWRRDYPSDSYPRLIEAMAIDETAALKSGSWGLGQVMGFNHKAAGYETVQDMVLAFMEDEDAHLEAMVSFIIANGLDDEIRRHDWTGFARGYNGAGYRQNQYDIKLASRFAWWRKQPDTPWTPGEDDAAPVIPVQSTAVLRRGDKGSYVHAVQEALVGLGFDLKIDGDFGPATEAALRAFQHANGLLVDGWVGPKTGAAMRDALAKPKAVTDPPNPIAIPVPKARPELAGRKTEDVVEVLLREGSRTIQSTEILKGIAKVKQLGGALGLTSLAPILAFAGSLPSWAWLLIAVVAVVVLGLFGLTFYEKVLAKTIERARADDAITGKFATGGPA